MTPAHLQWMTQSEVRANKERQGIRFGKAKGEPRCKLDEQKVGKIWTFRGKATTREIGAMFGVSYHTISDIYLGKTWPGGKASKWGFKRGNPGGRLSLMKRRAIIGAPSIISAERAADDFAYVDSVLPLGAYGRDDIRSMILLDMIDGKITRDQVPALWKTYSRAFINQNTADPFGADTIPIIRDDWEAIADRSITDLAA